jgi:hypothetical protein
MGCFDSVYIRCPECREQVEFQSKAGDCLLESFNEDNVPSKVALDINGEDETCPKCGIMFTVVAEIIQTCRVRGVKL